MKIRRSDRDAQEIKLDMTAMIDIVFQLLIFFVMTFKTPIYEGDFGIKMPALSTTPRMDVPVSEPLIIRMKANADNDLETLTIVFKDDNLSYNFDPNNPGGVFKSLNDYVIGIVGKTTDPSAVDIEAELEIDASLKYDFTVKAIESVSGYKEGDQTNQLIEKINFKDTGE